MPDTCPFCSEQIQPNAVKCRHCGEFLRGGAPATGGRPPEQEQEISSLQGRATTAFILSLLGVFLCVLLAPVGAILGFTTNRRLALLGAQKNGLATAAIVVGILGSCLVLLIFVPIMAAIAIPGILAAKRAAGEQAAQMRMQNLYAAQMTFAMEDVDGNQKDDYWVGDVAGLAYIQSPGGARAIDLIDAPLAEADSDPMDPLPEDVTYTGAVGSGGQPLDGYYFKAVPRRMDPSAGQEVPYHAGDGRNAERFAICAYPASYPAGGRKTFLVTEVGVVYSKDTGGTPVDVCPADPPSAGWLAR